MQQLTQDYSLKAFWIPITLWVFQNGANLYRQTRATYESNKASIRPAPAHISRVLNLIFLFAVYLLATSFSAPENVFKLTQARLQTNVDVIFSRLGALRPLTGQDQLLKAKLLSKESRLIYMAFGPEALTSCTFCDTAEPRTFAIYALPWQLFPHILNALVLGTATSSLAGPEGMRWRTWALVAVGTLIATDLYMTFSYDVLKNTAGYRTEDYDFFYWKTLLLRPLGIAAVDAVFGWALWMSSTNRLFVLPPTLQDRLGVLMQAGGALNQRLGALGAVRHTIARSSELRTQMGHYWTMDNGVFENEAVVQTAASARARMDMRQLEGAADKEAGELVKMMSLDPLQAQKKAS